VSDAIEPQAVVNASPLILLFRIGALHLLQAAAPRLIVPDAVLAELQAKHDGCAAAVISTFWLQVVTAPPPSAAVTAADLGAGETAVLAYAEANPGTAAILDDRAARRLAAQLTIPTRGTLGVVLLAKRQARIPAARPVVEALVAVGMYLPSKTIDDALMLVQE
jgi:predicted nucleic acid-binding protein